MAIGQRIIDRGNQLIDGRALVAILVERLAQRDRLSVESDVDAEHQLVDRHELTVVAIAGAAHGRQRRRWPGRG
jgi:hypothetical protein